MITVGEFKGKNVNEPQSLQSCPITDVLVVAGAKWTVEIMRELTLQPTRTRRFLAHIPGLTMKSLRQRLQQFEYLGLVVRFQYDQKPLKVDYTLTDKGRRFNDLLDLAKQIADEWHPTSCQCPLSHSCVDNQFSCSKRRELRAKFRSEVVTGPKPSPLNGSD